MIKFAKTWLTGEAACLHRQLLIISWQMLFINLFTLQISRSRYNRRPQNISHILWLFYRNLQGQIWKISLQRKERDRNAADSCVPTDAACSKVLCVLDSRNTDRIFFFLGSFQGIFQSLPEIQKDENLDSVLFYTLTLTWKSKNNNPYGSIQSVSNPLVSRTVCRHRTRHVCSGLTIPTHWPCMFQRRTVCSGCLHAHIWHRSQEGRSA